MMIDRSAAGKSMLAARRPSRAGGMPRIVEMPADVADRELDSPAHATAAQTRIRSSRSRSNEASRHIVSR
jgi:hypothetical protein